jgi:hypothetical protein
MIRILIVILVWSFLSPAFESISVANELINKKLLCKGVGKWTGTYENSPHGLHFINNKKVKFYTPGDISYPNDETTEVTLEYLSTVKEIILSNPNIAGAVSVLNRQNLVLNANTSEPKRCENVENNFDFKSFFLKETNFFKQQIKLKNKI